MDEAVGGDAKDDGQRRRTAAGTRRHRHLIKQQTRMASIDGEEECRRQLRHQQMAHLCRISGQMLF